MGRTQELIKGADVSTLLEVERHGGRFSREDGSAADALEILKENGINLIRLRLWNDPYDGDAHPYGAGICDLDTVMTLAARAGALGIPWMLDFHYSDFWADPGKQIPPKAWRTLDADGLERAVYDYTGSVMRSLEAAGLLPSVVSIGNEITNGLLWPLGRTPNFANIARFVSAGIRAVREVSAETKVMIHLDNGGNNAIYRGWFGRYFECGGADFDIIGLSYYPYWHGPIGGLRDNMMDIARRYGKELVVAETSAGFTLEDYADFERLTPETRKGMAATERLAARTEYPMTPEGQSRFMRDLADVIRDVPEGLCRGFIYWEPAWIPVPEVGWASEAALRYTGEKGPGGNEWANQALFDYTGRALPALGAMREL